MMDMPDARIDSLMPSMNVIEAQGPAPLGIDVSLPEAQGTIVFDDTPEMLETEVEAQVNRHVGDDPRSWGKHALNPVRAQLAEDALELDEERKVQPLPLPTAEQVRRYSRELPFDEQAVGVEFTRCGGPQPVNLSSFAATVAFLKPMSPYIAWQTHGAANYIGVSYYADWIRDVVGDEVLADAIAPYGETDEAMGIQLDRVRPIIRVRLKQYEQVCPEVAQQAQQKPLF